MNMNNTTTTNIKQHRAFRFLIFVFMATLSACAAERSEMKDAGATLKIAMPSMILQSRAIDVDAVSVTVMINQGSPIPAFRNSEGNWTIRSLARADYPGTNSISIIWEEQVGEVKLLLAEYTGTFTLTDAPSIEPVGGYVTDGDARFDYDSDGFSNLAERTAVPPTNPISQGVFVAPVMVDIAAGCFDMGSPPLEPERDVTEGPQFNVCVNDFKIGKYEVTFEEYDVFALNTGRTLPNDNDFGRGAQPVINVDWVDATTYAAWLSAVSGKTFRLATEAEWEYAARAGTTTAFNTGDSITTDQANFDGRFTYNGSEVGEYRQRTISVGAFPENAFGLHDMHGNVSEWTCSAYSELYNGSEQVCDPNANVDHVIRGGSFDFPPTASRSANRIWRATDNQSYSRGFRLVEE